MNEPKIADRSGRRLPSSVVTPAARRIPIRSRVDRILSQALEIDTIGVVLFGYDGRVTWANDAFLRLSRYTREDVEAGRMNLEELTAPAYASELKRECAELCAGGHAQSGPGGTFGSLSGGVR